jgi:hypothetical protein
VSFLDDACPLRIRLQDNYSSGIFGTSGPLDT